eukprot:6568571-Prymnesium_polylepis.1
MRGLQRGRGVTGAAPTLPRRGAGVNAQRAPGDGSLWRRAREPACCGRTVGQWWVAGAVNYVVPPGDAGQAVRRAACVDGRIDC